MASLSLGIFHVKKKSNFWLLNIYIFKHIGFFFTKGENLDVEN